MHKTIKPAVLSFMTALIVFLPFRTHAENTHTLASFHATYKVIADNPIAMEGESERILTITDGQQWHFKSKASSLFARIDESSYFSMNNGHIQPEKYLYKRKVLGKTRQARLNFNWQENTVVNNVENKPWTMEIKPGVLDKLSYQLQLQQDVAAGKSTFSYQVADGGRLKNYQFAVKGQETIKTPAGIFSAVRVERVYNTSKDRKTLIWFAPELDYQLVKLHRQEKKNKTYTLSLKSLNK